MKKDLKCNAVTMSKVGGGLRDIWVYEMPTGLEVYGSVAMRDSTYIATIPVSTIRAYLRRLDKGKETK